MGKRKGTRFTVCKVHLLTKFAIWRIRKQVLDLNVYHETGHPMQLVNFRKSPGKSQRRTTTTKIPTQKLTSAVLTWYWRLLGLVLRSQILSLRNWLAM
jgi:hypothetical protein